MVSSILCCMWKPMNLTQARAECVVDPICRQGLSWFCLSGWKGHTAEQPDRKYLWAGSYSLTWMRRHEKIEIHCEGRNLGWNEVPWVGWGGGLGGGSDLFTDTVRMQLLSKKKKKNAIISSNSGDQDNERVNGPLKFCFFFLSLGFQRFHYKMPVVLCSNIRISGPQRVDSEIL